MSHAADHHHSFRGDCFLLDSPQPKSNQVRNAEIKIVLVRVALYEHPLFGHEDRLYAQLRLLYGEYHRQLKAQKLNYLIRRFRVQVNSTQTSHRKAHDRSVNLRAMKVELTDRMNTLCLIVAEEQTVTRLAESLYTTWNQMKGLRQHQNYISTPAKLVAINVRQSSTVLRTVPSMAELLNEFEAQTDWTCSYASGIYSLYKKFCRLLLSTSDFVLKLYTTAELTYDDPAALPMDEIRRRRRIRQQRLYVVVMANDHKVALLQAASVEWPAFTVQLEHSLRLGVFDRPFRLDIQLWQHRLMLDWLLASVPLPIPGVHACYSSLWSHVLLPTTAWFHFASHDVTWDVKFSIGDDVDVFLNEFRGRCSGQRQNSGVWSPGIVAAVRWNCYDVYVHNQLRCGILPSRLRRTGVIFEVCERHLTGALLASVCWVRAYPVPNHLSKLDVAKRNCLPPDSSKSQVFMQLGPFKSTPLYESTRIYPFFFRSNRFRSRLVLHGHKGPRSTAGNAGLIPSHHRLLRLRHHQSASFCGPIPCSNEVQNDTWLCGLLEAEQRRCRRAITQQSLEIRNMPERVDARVLVFVQRVHDSVMERCRRLNVSRRPLAALVSEGTPLPEMRTRSLVDAALEFTARRHRALKPPRKQRSAVISTGECSILVQVISAHVTTQQSSPLLQGVKTAECGFFVCASFQEHNRRTMLALGRNPRWKEILDMPFSPALGDFSPTKLMQVNDSLHLSLFSERDETSRGHNLLRQKFLGDIQIPFSTLYSNMASDTWLQGMLKLRAPYVHLGCDDETCRYLHVAIFLRPLLTAPSKMMFFASSIEDEVLIRYGICWLQELRIYLENICDSGRHATDERVPKRTIEVFGNSMQGDAILICRYLHPQKPPIGVNTFTKAARFVSLIPFLDDWQSFGCSNLDVWCTSQEFLDIGAGDWEEHGILLHNFMWWLQLHAKSPADDPSNLYLVIGSGIPEGNTIYVMQCHDYCSAEKIMLWNSCTGGMSHAAEKICPLIDIGCLVSSSNIYANIQAMTSLRLISFNYLNKELWRPLFADDKCASRQIYIRFKSLNCDTMHQTSFVQSKFKKA